MSQITDMTHKANLVAVAPLQVRNATTTGSPVNRGAAVVGGPYQALTFFVIVGTVTDGAHPLTMLESADGITYTPVAMVDLIIASGNSAPKDVNGNYTAAFGPLVTNMPQKVGYIGLQPYVNLTSVDTGATGAAYSVYALLSSPLHLPV